MTTLYYIYLSTIFELDQEFLAFFHFGSYIVSTSQLFTKRHRYPFKSSAVIHAETVVVKYNLLLQSNTTISVKCDYTKNKFDRAWST